ncbi:hypothetical protein SAMN04487866_103157 [Thermoactinomyces sp. DSM 45891]|uniref:hypothetical protein n=1 Tax=Thermoactinomyces sp. DSM 45891 TaxID=1761907 RepID=UPI000923190E|nr:hypothetical protein [Thermoactinomyces sp. DSM 45891]SFX28658.1 hypothetical protein SAMN04487866_103157 [Thermoactinomyces sp. DSM 45891]
MNGRQSAPSGSSQKMLTVTFDISDPLEKDLYMFIHQKTDNFGNLAKHLLFAWRHGYQKGSGNQSPKIADPITKKNEIRNSGLPFG